MAAVLNKGKEASLGSASATAGGKYRRVHLLFEQQFHFFMSTAADRYKARNLSGVYCAALDFCKFHLLDRMLPFLSDSVVQHADEASYRLLQHVGRTHSRSCTT